MRLLAILAVLAACGDNVHGGYAPGERLLPIGFVYEDGTIQPHADRFFDLARDETCELQTWADGARYCSPASSTFVFADQFCRKPIAKVIPDAPVGYAEVPFVAPDGTTSISKLRPLGAPIGHVPYYRTIIGDCVGPSDDPDATYVEVTPTELDEADFVRVTRTFDEIDDRLAAVRLTTADGLSLPIGFFDRDAQLDCAGHDSPDSDTTVCAPTHHIAATPYFSDPQCTLPTADAAAVDLDPTLQAISFDANGCHHDFALSTERALSPTYYGPGDGTCTESANSHALYAAGHELDDPPLGRTALESTTRFSPIVDGWVPLGIRDTYVHDNVGDFDCKPVAGRCLPDAVAVATTEFADPQCENPIDLAFISAPVCGQLPRVAVTADQRVLRIGDVYRQPLFISNGNLDVPCIPAPAVPGKEPHALGDQIQLGSVTEAVLR